jgi:adenylosuccinate synthase
MIEIDVVLDLARGDCGKGKVSHYLAETNTYTHSLRWNGSGNAGHTIYHEGKKFVTHQVPSGVFYGIRSIIGPGCVVNPDKLKEEIEYLEGNGVAVRKHLRIAKNAHVVTAEHVAVDSKDTAIGTTKTGNGPAYTDKYARKGMRAIEHPFLSDMTIDMHKEFYNPALPPSCILAEGAQGFYLDIDWGDYPYVTSSHCGIGGVLLNGFNPKHIRHVYGVAKAYETYVGAAKFEPTDDPVFQEIRKLGQEFGATTGRPRQCNWVNVNELIKAAQMNGVDSILFNKIDILETVNVFKVRKDNKIISLNNRNDFEEFLTTTINSVYPCQVKFSNNPYNIK